MAALLLLLLLLEASSGDGTESQCTQPTRGRGGCTMPVLRAEGLSAAELTRRCAAPPASRTPLLVTGLLDRADWQSMSTLLGRHGALLAEHGDEDVRVSLTSFLGAGPEASSDLLDAAKLAFMRRTWPGP